MVVMTNDETLRQAVQLIQSGRKAEAQLILEPLIQMDPQNILAWMWEVEIFPADCDKIKVLEICLEHNPGNPRVMRALEIVKTRSGLLPAPKPANPLRVPVPVVTAPPPPSPASQPSAPRAAPLVPPVASPEKSRVSQARSRQRPIENKHPDWPVVDGIVDFSQVRILTVNRIPTYYSEIDAMYVVKSRDYRVKFKYAKKTSLSPFDAEILTSNYHSGTGIKVSYDPHNPGRAWVHEWDPRLVKRKLREYKDRPEVSAEISRQYRRRMLRGLWITSAGVVATVVGTLIFSQLGLAYVVFTGAIVVGLFYFITGLVGWLWNMD